MGAAPTVPVATVPARDLAARLDPDTIGRQVFEEILHRCYEDHAEDAAFVSSLEQSCLENVRALVHLFAGRLELENLSPLGALAFADLSAELDIPVSLLERAYLVGMGRYWQEWFELGRRESEQTGVPLADFIHEPTVLLFAYIDQVLVAVVSQYDEARADMIRTREHLRRATLAQVLDGNVTASDPVEIERALGYPLRTTHLAVCLDADGRGEIDRALPALRAAAAAVDVLSVQRGARRWVVWLGRAAGYGTREAAAVRRALVDLDVTATISDAWTGLDGLRRAYDEATLAAGVQHALGVGAERVLAYRDVRLEALLLSDEERARRFVAEELGPLAADDPRMERIRETLLVWLSHGTHVAAAAILGLHENTVRNRVRHAEDLLPGLTAGRRTELQVALRLERVLRSA